MGGDIILLYVLSDERYRKIIKSNKLRLLPNYLLPSFKPKIIEVITKNNNIIGKVIGNNIKQLNLLDTKELDLYIEGILKIKSEADTNLYIEDINKFPLDILDVIQERTGLKISSGNNVRMSNIPNIIKEVFRCLGKDHNSTDTLIICDSKDKLVDTIKLLSETINFFTVIGMDLSLKEQVYNEVLDCTGISIFQPNNIYKIIKNYGLIINYNDKIELEMKEIRNQSVIIDFSQLKQLQNLESTRKDIIYIQDINFKFENSSAFIGNHISPSLLESFGENGENGFSQINTNKDFYFIEDFIKSQIKIKRRV